MCARARARVYTSVHAYAHAHAHTVAHTDAQTDARKDADAGAQTYPLSSSETYKRTRACASTYIERRAFGEHCVRIRVPVPRKRPY